MPGRSLGPLVDRLHRVAADCDNAVPDGALLQRFQQVHDPAAFELIVWRHGAMVQAVCQRVLGQGAEVDDAFQATFLVLLGRARSIRNRDSLAGWLHGVAFRVARRCRRNLLTRRRHERGASRPESQYPPNRDQTDLGPILHAEIDRLPERLRRPFVLCEIEGRTNAEAAALLAVPYGTIRSRLSRAREQLRRRLTQRGVVLGATGFGSMLAFEPVSAGLVQSAVHGALHFSSGTAIAAPAAVLANGVIKIMFATKLKLVAYVGLAASMVLGVGLMTVPRLMPPANSADEPSASAPAEILPGKPAPPKAEDRDPAISTSLTQPETAAQPPKPADQEEPAEAPQKPSWATKFFPDGLTYDFGMVNFGSQPTHSFKIFNPYAVPFVISDAKATSDCVSTVVPTGSLEPRQSAEFVVNIDARRIVADGRSRTVRVFVTLTSVQKKPSDAVYSASCSLTITFAVQAEVAMSKDKMDFGVLASPSTIDFGNVSVGELAAKRLIIRGPTGKDFKVDKIEGLSDGISIKLPERSRPGHLLTIEFKPQQAGNISRTLTFRTDLPGHISTTMVVNGTGVSK